MIKNILFVHVAQIHKTGKKAFAARLAGALQTLEKEIKKTFCFFCPEPSDCAACAKRAAAVMSDFVQELPEIQRYALSDINAAYNGDPAAKDAYEILLCYPGLKAVTYQRIANFFYRKNISLIPRVITEYAHSKTGIDIHPGARIGSHFFIDHGTGVVIGETAVIGNNVKIYQGVTLGAKSFPLDANGKAQKNIKRHPDVGDNVTIYGGATILGPIKIGADATIAANAWITADVAPNTVCKQLNSCKIRREK
jgi:serine O-acetyltransferase